MHPITPAERGGCTTILREIPLARDPKKRLSTYLQHFYRPEDKISEMKRKNEGLLAIIAAFCVLFASMLDTRFALQIAVLSLLGFGLYLLIGKPRR